MVQYFDNMTEFLADIDKGNHKRVQGGTRFEGNETWQSANKDAIVGWPKSVSKAEAMFDKIDSEGLDIERNYWESDVAGAFPIVPAAVSGMPLSMNRQVTHSDDHAPIKIYASCCCSGGLEPKHLMARGTAILALALKLSSIRPVELFVLSELHGSTAEGSAIPVIKINLQPLDVAAATYALTSTGFLRVLSFTYGKKHGFSGAWAYNSQPQDRDWDRRVREELGCNEDDIYIRGAYITDDAVKKPVQWLQGQLDKFKENDA